MRAHPLVISVPFLLEKTEGEFEEDCQQLTDHFTLRKQTIEAIQIENQTHRKLILTHLMTIVDAGIKLVKSAERFSRIPAGLSIFDRRPFLRIKMKETTSEERRVKLDELLDEFITTGIIPSGVSLLQRAVRHVITPISVETLFLNPQTPYYEPITALAKESGGEKLTATVMLFCILVRLRSIERTHHHDASSCLILDNPFGAASRPLFVELQREVAKAMNIQLIYLTGIDAPETLRMLPHIVRLRNDATEQKTGDGFIVRETTELGIQQMQIHLPPPEIIAKDEKAQKEAETIKKARMNDKTEKNAIDQMQQALNTLGMRHVNLFVVQLGKQKKLQIALPDLWRLFQDIFPIQPTGPERRFALLAVLDEAQKMGVIRLPAKTGRCWEKSLAPHLPLWVRRNDLSATAHREKSWKNFPWDELLAWIADLEQLSIEQETFLLQVQKELVSGTFQEPAPLAYRSLQLTGNEKRLKALASTALFHPGRLSLSFLGCLTDIPPFHVEILGAQPRALIFENFASFRIASRILKGLPYNPYGLVGYGGGTAFEQAVLHLTTIPHHLDVIEYVGDLDRPGLRTARAASLRAQTEGLPPLNPAASIHQAMVTSCAAFGHPKGIDYLPWEKRKHQDDEVLVSWLPAAIQQQVLGILQTGRRIPEEVLGPKEFAVIWSESEKHV